MTSDAHCKSVAAAGEGRRLLLPKIKRCLCGCMWNSSQSLIFMNQFTLIKILGAMPGKQKPAGAQLMFVRRAFVKQSQRQWISLTAEPLLTP